MRLRSSLKSGLESLDSKQVLQPFSPEYASTNEDYHRWLGFLVFSFGAICAGIAGTTNFAGVAALRFLLGAAEAGIFPGMIFFLSFWYRPEERATRIAAFLCSATLAGAFGG